MTYNVFGGTLSLPQSINPNAFLRASQSNASVCIECLKLLTDKFYDCGGLEARFTLMLWRKRMRVMLMRVLFHSDGCTGVHYW